MQKPRRICVIVCTFNSLLLSVCSMSLVSSVMLSIYGRLSSHVLAIHPSKKAAVDMQGNVYLSKIENSS